MIGVKDMRIIAAIKGRTIIAVAATLITVAILLSVLYTPNIETFASSRKLPVYGVQTEEKKVALTFDAAWGADKTSAIMDILEQYGAKGTFFLVGFWVDEYPEKVKEIVERGHLIGNHSDNHLHMSGISAEQLNLEINNTTDKICTITGVRPLYFRAPFGEYDNALIGAVEENGMQAVQWSIDTLDWKGISGGKIADRVISNVKEGSIVLSHNNSDHILEALPIILEGLKVKGLKAVTLDELVLKNNYRIDVNGTQIPLTA